MPYDFFLEYLFDLPLRHKKMFGVDSYYIEEKIVFALRYKEDAPHDNGIWIASKLEHHKALKKEINGLRPIQTYGIKTWLVLPEDFDQFEREAAQLATLIKKNSSLVGNIPKPKRKRAKWPKNTIFDWKQDFPYPKIAIFVSMKVVPQAFYQHSNTEKILVDGLSSVLYKSVTNADLQNQRYLSTHAITLVLKGALRIEDYEGTLQIIEKDRLIFLPKGLYMISDIIPKNETFDALVFFFDDTVTHSFLDHYPDLQESVSSNGICFEYNQDLRLFVDTLLQLYRGKGQHQFTKSKLLEFLHLLALSSNDGYFVKALQSLKVKERKSIRAFMEEHFDKPLDVDDYAYLTGRSVSTFQRDFKSRFQHSPKQWLIQKRLEKAAALLQSSASSISEITAMVGYENTSHFIKAFQRKYGESPKQFHIRHRRARVI